MKKRKWLSGEAELLQTEKRLQTLSSRGSLTSILEEEGGGGGDGEEFQFEFNNENLSSRERDMTTPSPVSSSLPLPLPSSASTPLTPPSSSSIHDGVWEVTNEHIIVKVSSWTKIRRLRGKHLEDPIKEIQCLQLIGNYNPQIASHVTALQDDYFLYNVMEYCEDGDLYSVVMNEIHTNGRVKEHRAREWFRQIIVALYHLQQKGVCHRDLSLENIMVHKGSIKVVDFGLALRVPFKSMTSSSNSSGGGCRVTDVSEGSQRMLMVNQGLGSKWTYLSPEVIKKDSYFDGFAHDLWSAGVILYILLVGHKPFNWAHRTDQEYLQIAERLSLKDSLLYWNIDLTDDAFDLLQSMLIGNPRCRLTLSEIMQHPWVKGSEASSIDTANRKDTDAPATRSGSGNCVDAQSTDGSKKMKPKWFRNKKDRNKSKIKK